MSKKAASVKKIVRESYGKIAQTGGSCCSTSCCGSGGPAAENISKTIGYSEEEIGIVPEGANLGLGCGNPAAVALLQKGETVLDLGSGAGFDVFLAAGKVGPGGRVIGIDMTPEMIKRARANAQKGKYTNVEFRLGEIEKLPVDGNSVDVIISNCVINLSADKQKVFQEAFRVLKPGGRLMVSDLVLTKALPKIIQESVEACVGCLAGASMKKDYLRFIEQAGFENVKIAGETNYPVEAMANDLTAQTIMNQKGITAQDIQEIENTAASIKVSALKST